MTIKDNYSPKEFENLPTELVSSNVGCCIEELTAIQKRVDGAIKKAAKAKDSSLAAKSVTLRWYKIGDKAKAIEALQDAMVDVSDVQGDQSDAIRLLLEYQKNVAGGMKFLFALGASNMAANRTVVREVEMRLKNASEEEIGEMARNELRAVVAQLKAQLDLQEQQSRLAEDQKNVKVNVRANKENISANKLLIDANKERIELLHAKEVAQDKALREQEKIDQEQDAELKRQAEKDKEHDEKIAANRKNIDDNAKLIALIKETLARHRHEIAGVKVTSGSSKVAMAFSLAAFISSLVAVAIALFR